MVLSSADFFFKIVFCCCFFLFFPVIPVECQAVWIQIMPIGLNCLKGYQQATLVSKEFMTTIQAN